VRPIYRGNCFTRVYIGKIFRKSSDEKPLAQRLAEIYMKAF
jgi:hypothetical protein